MVLRRLFELSGLGARRVAVSVLLGTITVCFGVALLATSGYLISRAAEQPPILSLTIAIVAVRFLGLARPLARYGDRLWSHDLALRGLGRVRARFFERTEPLAPADLQSYRRGDLVARMVADVDALQGLYLRGIGPILVAIPAGALCVWAAASFLPAAGVVLAAGLVLGGIAVPLLAGRLTRDAGRSQSAARATLTAEIVESLVAAPELALYGAESQALSRVRAADCNLDRQARRDALVGGLGEGFFVLVAGLTLVGVLVASVNAHDTGALDRVLVATLALLALASFESVASLPAAARELTRALTAGRRVLEVIDQEPRVSDPAAPRPLPPISSLVFEGVTARYAPGEPPALRNVHLRLAPGERVALVGASGAGKTTVTNLLLRFLDPEQGRVTLGGCDLRQYRQDDVRRMFALAGQDAHVFDSTIRANLMLASPGATEAELLHALRRAHLDDWIESLPDGLETRVGEDGNRLSGGQRQRLTVARALLSDAPILVLDEPTAHLDPETARALVGDVLAAADERTVLLITHRPEGLELVDRVITLEDGEVAGTSPPRPRPPDRFTYPKGVAYAH